MSTTEGEYEIVLKRVEQTMPSNIEIQIGQHGKIDKEKLIKHIEERDKIGKQFVESHMAYLRSFKEENRFQSIKEELLST